MAEAQDTRSLIPGKRGCDRGKAEPHLGFADFLGSPVTPSPSSTSPSSACTRPSSLSRRFCVQSHGPGTKAVFVLSEQTHQSVLFYNMRDSRLFWDVFQLHLRDLLDQLLLSVDVHLEPLAQLLLVLQLHLLQFLTNNKKCHFFGREQR